MRHSHVDRRALRNGPRQFVSDYETEGLPMMNNSPVLARVRGTVRFYNSTKGYGFCTRDGAPDVFFHVSALKSAGIGEEVKQGDVLEFNVETVPGKGTKAVNIKLILAGG